VFPLLLFIESLVTEVDNFCFFGIGLDEFQVNIRSNDEAVVIGAALSLSSSAFVLQVLKL
jgi:Kef-type K+ transport system membrane component KefB